MKNLIRNLVQSDSSCEEMDIFSFDDLESIASQDECYSGLSPQDVDIFLEIKTKPDFSLIENKFDIKMHSELVEYWSQIWCPGFTAMNKKSVTANHTDEKIFVHLLTSQSHLDILDDDIEMYTQEMNDFGIEGVFFPIAFKEDCWNILFNNLDGCVYIQEHDPCEYVKVSNSIREFYSVN